MPRPRDPAAPPWERRTASRPLFGGEGFTARELALGDLQALQAFFEANPEYSLLVGGEVPGPERARELFEKYPPPEWPLKHKWVIGIFEASGHLVGVADAIEDLFAAGVWHLGLYLIATALHGSGLAQRAYRALEGWMAASGARWVRLGVVLGNARAERFWERLDYREIKRHGGFEMGFRVHTLRLMLKPLTGGELGNYLALVPRDRPDAR